MPKTTLAVNPKNQAMNEIIALYLVRRGMKKAELIKRTGIPRSTFYAGMRNLSTMNIGDMRKIYDVLQVPQEERKGL